MKPRAGALRHRPVLLIHSHRLMPGLSYPFVYECSNCDRETTVTRDDARDLATNPDSVNALEIVLQRWGWLRDDIKGLLFCPDCIDVPSEGKD